MSGILSDDPTCNTHNALQNITIGTYACGVTFKYRSTSVLQDVTWYGAPAVQQCCDKIDAPVFRIPGNTGCEMQYCEVPGSMTQGVTGADPVTGPDQDIVDCLVAVYKGDVPSDIGRQISWVDWWFTVRMYDTDTPLDEVHAPVVADKAPTGWIDTSSASSTNPVSDTVLQPTSSAASIPATNAAAVATTITTATTKRSIVCWYAFFLFLASFVARL